MASIFVQIPSYHDYELGRTIRDAIKKSSGMHVINFGVHLTYYKNNDIDIPVTDNVNIAYSVAPDNIGLGLSRNIANDFYNGEDYYLQIDSHMRFAQNWDDVLIKNYLKYKSMGANPAISSYPASYDYNELNVIALSNQLNVSYIDFIQDLSFQGNYVPHQRAVSNMENNVFSRSVAGGSIFTSGELASIKPNTKIFFWGEEILTAMRLYTHGFDIMLPESQNIYHLYYDADRGYKNLRRQVREDFPKECNALEEISRKELSRIVVDKPVGDQELGSSRTLEEYELFAGINFIDKKIVKVL